MPILPAEPNSNGRWIRNNHATTGHPIAWVKIPSVSSTTDTSFYLFYGDPSITTNQSDPVNTWDANFKAVYHLGNGTTLTATDSTGGNNGTLVNGPTATAGKIYGAAHFVSTSNQAIDVANPGTFLLQRRGPWRDGSSPRGRKCRSLLGRDFQ